MSEVCIQSIDQLGLVMGMIEELEIMEQIDQMLPSLSDDKKVSCATSVAAMILNGLGYAKSTRVREYGSGDAEYGSGDEPPPRI